MPKLCTCSITHFKRVKVRILLQEGGELIVLSRSHKTSILKNNAFLKMD